MSEILLLVLVAVLILLNSFFVIAEYSLVRARRGRLEQVAPRSAKARLALEQLDNINTYISTCQVGVTMISIGIGALGEPVIAHLLERPFGPVLGHTLAVVLSVVIAYLIITSFEIVIGEMVPKIYAIAQAERVVMFIARPLQLCRILFHPFTVVLTKASGFILRPLGIDINRIGEEATTSEDLKMLIAQSEGGGHLDQGEAGMLRGVFHLHEQQARQVMTPIPAVVSVNINESAETALRQCIASGHTRLVVTEEDSEHIRGIVHTNSLAERVLDHGPQASIADLVHETPIVPETKPLDDLLTDLQQSHSSMAVVLDEYGRAVGVVSVEDILEETVGEIADETDSAPTGIRRLNHRTWLVQGEVAITDLADYGVSLPLASDAYNSIGGFIFSELGRLPQRGDTVSAFDYQFRVESVRDNRIITLRIHQLRPAV